MLFLDESYHDMNDSDADDGELGVCKTCKAEKLLYHYSDTMDSGIEVFCCTACAAKSNRVERADLEKEIAENEEYMSESEEE